MSLVFVVVPLYIVVPVPCVQLVWLFRSIMVLSVCVVVSQVRWMVVLVVGMASRLFGGCGV